MNYEIMERGEKNPEPIKSVSGIPGEKGFIPLSFPCLSVHVCSERDSYPDSYFCVTWSNASKAKGSNPGKFKLQRMETRRKVIWMTNADGRRMKHKGRFVVDQLAMNQTKPEYERVGLWDNPPEAETLENALDLLTKRFGEATALEVLALFTTHEVYAEYSTLKKAA